MDASSEHPRKQDPIRTDIGRRDQHCEVHGPYLSHGYQFTFGRRREYWLPCPDCAEATRAEELRKEAEERASREQAHLRAMLAQTGVPARWRDWTLDSFQANEPKQAAVYAIVRDFAENFQRNEESGDGLILAGSVGTGKTHLAVGVLQYLMPERVGVYTTFMQMIRSVRATWHKASNRSESEVIETLGSVPLLVLDELGMQFGTEAEQITLFDVMDMRYRDARPTIICTNQDSNGFREFVGDRVYDRLKQTGTWVTFDWASHRPAARRRSGAEGRGIK